MDTGSFPGVKSGWGRDADLSPPSNAEVMEDRAIPLLPLWAVRPVQNLSACTRVHFTLTFTNSYVFRTSLVHHQSVQHIPLARLLSISVSWMHQCCNFCSLTSLMLPIFHDQTSVIPPNTENKVPAPGWRNRGSEDFFALLTDLHNFMYLVLRLVCQDWRLGNAYFLYLCSSGREGGGGGGAGSCSLCPQLKLYTMLPNLFELKTVHKEGMTTEYL